MHRICLPMFLKMLSSAQKVARVPAEISLKMADEDDDFLKNIAIGDKTWSFLYDLQTKL